MFFKNSNLFIIAIVAIVNALGYGIVIPVLYSYSLKFGLNDFQNGLLFALFSICQFISTPIIGRLSDRYGRKPLLLASISGTAISFIIMAFAPSAGFLFFARALDGLTAGNIPVAAAVISDTTTASDRAKGFGIMGASFGFGFIFGPAISALTLGFGPAVPFLIAASVSSLAVLLTLIFLPETNKNMGQVSKEKIFDFGKLIKSAVDEKIGETLLITFFLSLAFSMFTYGYQPFSIKSIGLTPIDISINFTIFGVMGLITQLLLVPRLVKKYGEMKNLLGSATLLLISFLLLSITVNKEMLIVVSMLLSISNSFIGPIVQTLLSREADSSTQGAVLGLNSSYASIGMIFGPIIGGTLAVFSLSAPFFGGAIAMLGALILVIKLKNKLRLRIA